MLFSTSFILPTCRAAGTLLWCWQLAMAFYEQYNSAPVPRSTSYSIQHLHCLKLVFIIAGGVTGEWYRRGIQRAMLCSLLSPPTFCKVAGLLKQAPFPADPSYQPSTFWPMTFLNYFSLFFIVTKTLAYDLFRVISYSKIKYLQHYISILVYYVYIYEGQWVQLTVACWETWSCLLSMYLISRRHRHLLYLTLRVLLGCCHMKWTR